MTNEQKRELKRSIMNEPNICNSVLADCIGCSISTVRKYRKIFAKSQQEMK